MTQGAYRSVLAALDLERDNDTPVVAGSRLADEQGADLRVVAVVRHSLLLAKGFFSSETVDRDVLLREARSAAVARIEPVATAGFAVDVMIGDPAETITAIAEHRSSDLIVIGARARRGSERLFGTTATDVLRLADGVDVYACHRADPHNPIENVIIAIDGSSITEEVLKTSADFLAANPDDPTRVHVICVVPKISSTRTDRALDNCGRYLQNSPWTDVEVRVEDRNLSTSIDAAIGEYDADLLIIGSGENMGIGWAIGSTTNDVLHDVSCDVLVIRP